MKYLLLILMTILIDGCYYDSIEGLYGKPGTTCDTTNPNYATKIVPILQANCLACHSNAAATGSGGGIRLQDYANVATVAQNGRLLGSIKHTSGYSAMPLGGGSLSSCDIAMVTSWINKGFPNN